jgi:general secretion pathway protein D
VIRRLLVIGLSLLALAACDHPGKPVLRPLGGTPGNTPAAERVNGGVGSLNASAPAQLAYGSAQPGASGRPGVIQSGGDVSLDFADTDLREVVAQVLGAALHENYTIDPAVKGSATFHTARPLPRSMLLQTLQVLLGQNGATLVQTGSIYRVVPIAEAATAGVAGSEASAGGLVLPLRYASAEALAKLLTPFAANGSKIAADAGRNALLIGGDPNARAALVALAQSFDVDVLAGQSYALLPVPTGDAKDFASAMQDVFRSQNGGALSGLVRVVPLERLNSVLVVAGSARYIEEARRIFNLVEKGRRFSERSWHVYYLQNSHADDVAYLLQQAFTPHNVTAQPSSVTQGNRGGGGMGGASSGFGQSGGGGGGGFGGGGGGGFGGGSSGGGSLGGGGGNTGGLGSGGLGSGGLGGGGGLSQGGGLGGTGGGAQAATTTAAPAASNPLLGGLDTGGGNGGGSGGDDTNAMRIIPNAQNNAVLVYSTRQEEATVEAMLRKVDILPLQVRIDATIAEVTLNDQLQYGTQFFFKEGSINQTLTSATSISGGFIFGAAARGVTAALSALQAVTTVNVLSSPELMVLDNQTAQLQVGAAVPYLSQSSQSTLSANAPVVNSVQYQQTGVIMGVTPRVNSGGLVTLDISQEVSDVADTVTTAGLTSPTFNERRVVSRVVVQDGQTIGLAGLIQDSQSKSNSGIPWLKDVPILGLLLGEQSNKRQRTELLVLITPHVIRDQRDAKALTEDLREQLPNAALVPAHLQALPLSGSIDPSEPLRRKLKLER